MKAQPATLLLAFLVVTGCRGESGLRALPSVAQPAAVPSAATARSSTGAEAYVAFFYDRLNEAFSRADAASIRALSSAECGTCRSYERALELSRLKGELIRGTSFTVTDVAVRPLHATVMVADVWGTTPARQIVNPSGDPVANLAANGPFHVQVTLTWATGRWWVSGIRRAP